MCLFLELFVIVIGLLRVVNILCLVVLFFIKWLVFVVFIGFLIE